MDGSDDYFLDDIVLDDQTLAVLDSEEQKYLTQAGPPPAKRQKTNGWKPVEAQSRPPVGDDNDLPEISVHGDGSYAFRGATKVRAPLQPPRVSIPPQRVAAVPPASRVQTRPEPRSRPRDPLPRPTHAPPGRDPSRTVVSDASHVAEELRKQIEELQRLNHKYQTELKDATDAKLAKQGEVSILRTGLEKAAQDHATQVAKLKLAKEESEAKQIALQKEMKAEMERLKTQFIFKQHELESSSRKPPLSVRSKRIARDIPSTPLAVPSQIKGWNQNAGFPDQSPVQARVARGSPQGLRRTPEKSKKLPKLLGFQNSFTDATPVRNIHSRVKKETEMSVDPIDHCPISSSPVPFPQQLVDIEMAEPTGYAGELTGPETDDIERPHDGGVFSDDLGERIEPFNWKAELTRIVLTHSINNTSPTFKILVGLALPPESAEVYSNATTRVLELVASTSHHRDYESSLVGLCRCFTSMIAVLNRTDLVSELSALLNLLVCLSCSLPDFAPCLLAQKREDEGEHDILEILCSIIRDHVDPAKRTHSRSALGGETIGLLEGLCWNVKDDSIDRLAVLCDSKDILMILLDVSQPGWLVGRTVRLLVFLATHPKLSRELLSNAETRPLSAESKARDNTRLPHIERLCSYLIDASRQDAEAVDMKSQILTFCGVISVGQADVHAALVGCQVLIPSLVAFLTQMTTLLWEGDEFLANSETTAKTIRTLNQALFLLHHLVFGMEPNFNLRHRLHYAPSRAFNGITHMFIVTFGRLGCAEPPEWIESGPKRELESMSEMAQDLLDLVVDGPESESIWTAYQVDHADNSDTDEEDMEAKLLGT
ncbi:hypothetical protein DFH06DRAFT_1315198 [Mycena polygramma]|nr:hypothetical protein DFH06DRAFT_1315198 [Mycena polygramma]